MIGCIDVDYRGGEANAACILFEDWESERVASRMKVRIKDVLDYEPGVFYRRELPCILEVLKMSETEIDLVIVDGYVWLDGKRRGGLGAYLFHALDGRIPVIGVAKNFFFEDDCLVRKVVRGKSSKPLYVTSIGTDIDEAAERILLMQGSYRIPLLLKQVDRLSRQWEE